MRILHVAPFYEPAWGHGGMARAAAGLCRALAARGHQVSVATARLDAAHPAQECLGGVEVHRFAGPRALNALLFPLARGLGRFLEERAARFDVAHLHGHRNGLALRAGPTLAAAGVPYVIQFHGTYPTHGQRVAAKRVFDLVAGDRLVAGAAALVAVSEAERRDLPGPAALIPNGVDPCGHVSRAAAAAGGRKLLFVGSDAPQKRGASLVALLREVEDASLSFVGRFGDSFRRQFQSFGGRVSFAGVLPADRLARAYASADLLLHPARQEAFGLVPFEAALAGLPAVVAGGHGCGEWFSRAGGCVVPPADEVGFLGAVEARLAEPSLGWLEARAVARFARRELGWARAAGLAESLYEQCVESRPGVAQAC